ncbi:MULTISPECIES: type II toxin-antitoxin system RatA family toxin [unclassified Caulobacter]|uniref:type II toxin-antitoxin system RatA family toxin n=1 Tax=unclassified Caulobacter TaxID=2648921 RepID=UPI000D339149|nr:MULTISPECIES: SRPBCC family protein [unclassified Caulobacter]PTS91251.1 ubiquinone-binding protein [Caulobacter sp. HMWF009]PTT04498.1 ubiquinone-binding protein [Caulobacter sp. HMWF025]
MHRHVVTRVLPYTPEQLFALVGDVEAYPQFVPWITAMRTWNAREDGPVSTVDAEAQVGFSFLREKFATRVRRDAEHLTVDVSLLYGPFKRLANQWRFVAQGDETRIEFVIDFAFKSRMLDGLLAANLDRAADKLIACFESRARAIHGTAPA